MTGNFVRCELLERILFENGSCDFSLLLTRSWQSQQILIDRNLQMQQLCSAIKTNKEKERSEDTDEHTYTNVHTFTYYVACTHTHTHTHTCSLAERERRVEQKMTDLRGWTKKQKNSYALYLLRRFPFSFFLSKSCRLKNEATVCGRIKVDSS
jgi:hypothetical protein